MGGWLILRDSALFSVDDVTIVGLSANAAPVVGQQLIVAARQQTTTDFSAENVRQAVATYSLITGVRAETHFPHGVTLYVREQLPVVRMMVSGEAIPVAADGSVVTGFSPSVHLATVRSRRTSRSAVVAAIRLCSSLLACSARHRSRCSAGSPPSPAPAAR